MSTLYKLSTSSKNDNDKLNSPNLNLTSKSPTNDIPLSSPKIKRTIDEHHKKSKIIRNRNFNYIKNPNQSFIQKNPQLNSPNSPNSILKSPTFPLSNEIIIDNSNSSNSKYLSPEEVNEKDTPNTYQVILKEDNNTNTHINTDIDSTNTDTNSDNNIDELEISNSLNSIDSFNSSTSDIINDDNKKQILSHNSSSSSSPSILNTISLNFSQPIKNSREEDEEEQGDETINLDEIENNSTSFLQSSSDSSDRNVEEEEELIRDIENSLYETDNELDHELDHENSSKDGFDFTTSDSSISAMENSQQSDMSLNAQESSQQSDMSLNAQESSQQSEMSLNAQESNQQSEMSLNAQESSQQSDISLNAQESSQQSDMSLNAQENSQQSDMSLSILDNSQQSFLKENANILDDNSISISTTISNISNSTSTSFKEKLNQFLLESGNELDIYLDDIINKDFEELTQMLPQEITMEILNSILDSDATEQQPQPQPQQSQQQPQSQLQQHTIDLSLTNNSTIVDVTTSTINDNTNTISKTGDLRIRRLSSSKSILNHNKEEKIQSLDTHNEEVINSEISSKIDSLHINDNEHDDDDFIDSLINPFELPSILKPQKSKEQNQAIVNDTKDNNQEIIDDKHMKHMEQQQQHHHHYHPYKREKLQEKNKSSTMNNNNNNNNSNNNNSDNTNSNKSNNNDNNNNNDSLSSNEKDIEIDRQYKISIPHHSSSTYLKEREQTPSPPDRTMPSRFINSTLKPYTIPKVVDTPLYYSTTLSSSSSSNESNDRVRAGDIVNDQDMADHNIHQDSIVPIVSSSLTKDSNIIIHKYKDKSPEKKESTKKNSKLKSKLRSKVKVSHGSSLRKEILKRNFQHHENDKNELGNKRMKVDNTKSKHLTSNTSLVNSSSHSQNHDHSEKSSIDRSISEKLVTTSKKDISSPITTTPKSATSSKSLGPQNSNSKIKKTSNSSKTINSKLIKKITNNTISLDPYVHNNSSSTSRPYMPVGIALKKEQGIITKHGVIPFKNDKSNPGDTIHHEIPVLNGNTANLINSFLSLSKKDFKSSSIAEPITPLPSNSIEKYFDNFNKKTEDKPEVKSNTMQLIIPSSHPKKSIKNYNQLTLNSSKLKTNMSNTLDKSIDNTKVPTTSSFSQLQNNTIEHKHDDNNSDINDTPLTYLRNSRKNLLKNIKNSIKKQSGKIQQTKSTAERKGLVVKKNKLVRKKKWLKSV